MDSVSVNRDVLAGDPFPHAATHHDEERNCFYCLGGWVFLGSLDHDGEERTEAIKCRKCDGTGTLRGE